MSWFSKNTLCQQKLAESSNCLIMTQQKIAEWAKICCLSKNQPIQLNMLCQQNLISPYKYWWWLSKNMLCYQKKFDKSAKWADSAKIRCIRKNLLTFKILDDDSTIDILCKQKFAVSAEISWYGKMCCVSKIWFVRTNPWWWLSKNVLYQQKIWQVIEMSWFGKNTLCQQKLAELSKCLMTTRQ